MKTIRKGSDIVVRWRIFRYGQEYDIALYRESISLVLSNMGEKKEITDYSIVDVNTIVFKYRAEDQGLGIYRLLLIDKSRNSTRIIEECNAFRLVNTSDAANNDGTLESAITITLTSELTAPADGLSAYEVALQNGFIGTEEEWLQSLVPDTTDIELAEAQRQAKELERIEAENTRQSAELERQNASTEAVSSANGAATNANNAATTAQQKAEEANTAASSANAVVEKFNSIIVQETGNSQDKVMSQKAVTDAMTASQAKLSELEKKTEGISKETIYTADDYVCIEDNNGNEVLYLDNNGFNAKNIKSNGKNVLTEHQDISLLATKEEVSSKQDKIEQVSKEERKGNNIVIESDSGQEIVRIDDNGFFVKGKEISSTGQSIASFEATKQPIGCVDIQMPIFDYNIVIGYGQSLAQGRGVFKSNFTQYNKCLYLYNKTLSTDYYTSYPPYYISNIPPAKIAANVLAYHLCGSYPNKKVIALNGGMGGYSIARLMDFARYGNNGTNIDVFHFPNYNSETLQDQTGALSRYADIIQQLRDCKEIADREGKTIGVVAFFFMQGEQDTYAGSTDTDNYSCGGDGMLWEQRFMQLRSDLFDDIKTIFEQERNPATFMGNLSDKWISNGNIWSAINKIIDENEDIYAVQPKYQLPNISDGHLDSNGYRWWGEYIGQDMVSVLINHFKPSLLRIASVERVGSKKLNVSFSAVKLPIVIDTHTSQEMKGLGFVIRDASLNSIGEVTATLENNIVMLESDVDIPEVAYLDYGLAYPKESGHLWGAGNIKDSSGIKSYYPYMEDLDWVDESGTWAVDYIPKDDNGNSYIGKPYPLNSWLYSERIKI